MSEWVIDKQFSFCYGHRVWSQQLEHEFCEKGDYQCKCRHLHGHEGLVHVFLAGNTLERGMVTDFKHLGWLKNFLDTYVDHRFIIDKSDPMFSYMVTQMVGQFTKQQISEYQVTELLVPVLVPHTDHVAGYVLDMQKICSTWGLSDHTPMFETLEGYFVVDFVPTSENLCKWLFDCATAKMERLNITVSQIDWYETPKSRSSYRK
jgi:6-pyruvoyltetrahydropterin/6-carboxytetrahydropterin synthase